MTTEPSDAVSPEAPTPKAYFIAHRAPIGKRFLAFGIDVFIVTVLMTIVTAIGGNDIQDLFVSPLFLYVTLGVLYRSAMDASKFRGTVGKWLMKLEVVDTQGLPLTPWHAYARNTALVLGVLTFGLPYLATVFNKQRATPFDFLSLSRVVHRPAPSPLSESWKPKDLKGWIAFAIPVVLGASILSMLVVVEFSVVIERHRANQGYRLLKPYQDVLEKHRQDNPKSNPKSLTEWTRGVQDSDLLPGSGHKASYDPSSGVITLVPEHLPGEIRMLYVPANHPFNAKKEPAWLCVAHSEDIRNQRLVEMSIPSSCAINPFAVAYKAQPNGKEK